MEYGARERRPAPCLYDPAMPASSPRPARPLAFGDTSATLNTRFGPPKSLGISALQLTPTIFYDNGPS